MSSQRLLVSDTYSNSIHSNDYDGLEVWYNNTPPEVAHHNAPELQDKAQSAQFCHDNSSPEVFHDYAPEVHRDVAGIEAVELSPNLSEKQPMVDLTHDRNSQGNRKRICGLSKPWFYGTIAIVVVTITAIVVGSVIGSFLSKNRHTKPIPTLLPSASKTAAPPTATAVPRVPVHGMSQLGSVAWQDGKNVTQCRVYYQDANSQIRESAWNASSGHWYVSNSGIAAAKNGTPIAASAFTGGDGISVCWLSIRFEKYALTCGDTDG